MKSLLQARHLQRVFFYCQILRRNFGVCSDLLNSSGVKNIEKEDYSIVYDSFCNSSDIVGMGLQTWGGEMPGCHLLPQGGAKILNLWHMSPGSDQDIPRICQEGSA